MIRMVMLASLALLYAGAANAQTTEICLGRVITGMNFSATPALQSGTALSTGAVYRYPNVNTGIDALVQIVAMNNGATLTTIDNNTAPVGGAPDLRAFFNPELGGSNARSVDFQFTFVIAGTSTPLLFDWVTTAIDVDGDSATLREYAEFQNTYAEYLLNSPTNLSVNASLPSAGQTRFESTTNFTAPGIDPSANQNIVASFYSKKSGFRYRIGTLGTGNTVRLTSLQFTCPNLPAPTMTTVPQDFGDAPASYGNPRHDILTGFRLGAAITAETGPYNNANANADAGDDGATFGTLRRGNVATVSLAVVGASGRVQAWFDWNRDGDFLDPGEQVALNITDNGTGDTNPASGTIGLAVTVPSAAVLGQTFARFRWGTQSDLDAAGTIIGRDGEVEDYAVTILGAPVLATTKTSAVYSGNSTAFFVPGNDIVYSITTTNVGSAATDAGSIFALDPLPAEVQLYLGDFDGTGPATGTVLFTQSTGAGLTFTSATDVKFSNSATAPANFAACTYTPVATNGYDPAVRYLCFNPKGALAIGGNFTVQFKAQIK